MDVICNIDNGSCLQRQVLELGFTEHSKFNITVGRCYSVLAMSMWASHIFIMLADDTKLPNWYPIDIFSVSNGRMPESWCFAYFGDKQNSLLSALWGYDEIVNRREHYDGLIERDADELEIFFRLNMKK